jgi:hypothetical protein
MPNNEDLDHFGGADWDSSDLEETLAEDRDFGMVKPLATTKSSIWNRDLRALF